MEKTASDSLSSNICVATGTTIPLVAYISGITTTTDLALIAQFEGNGGSFVFAPPLTIPALGVRSPQVVVTTLSATGRGLRVFTRPVHAACITALRV